MNSVIWDNYLSTIQSVLVDEEIRLTPWQHRFLSNTYRNLVEDHIFTAKHEAKLREVLDEIGSKMIDRNSTHKKPSDSVKNKQNKKKPNRKRKKK